MSTTPQILEAGPELRTQILELDTAGAGVEEIAGQVDATPDQVARVLAAAAEQVLANAYELRAQALAREDRRLQDLVLRALNEKADIPTLLAIHDRLARLWGLDPVTEEKIQALREARRPW